jgi:hypothetical protein
MRPAAALKLVLQRKFHQLSSVNVFRRERRPGSLRDAMECGVQSGWKNYKIICS